MATIFPPAIVKPKTTRGRPPGAHTASTAPFTSASRATRARPEKVSATASAPRSSAGAPTLVAGGAEVQQPATDVGGGKLIATVKDADGNVLGLAQSP